MSTDELLVYIMIALCTIVFAAGGWIISRLFKKTDTTEDEVKHLQAIIQSLQEQNKRIPILEDKINFIDKTYVHRQEIKDEFKIFHDKLAKSEDRTVNAIGKVQERMDSRMDSILEKIKESTTK